MKKILSPVVAAAIALTSTVTHAKTLEDVLKEKGVISEADYKEVTKSKPLDYKLGEGFTLMSSDEKFKLTLTSSYQIRYTFLDMDDSNNTPAKSAQDISKFELRRIRLFFNGHAYTKDLTYRMIVNFANSQNPATSTGLLEETFLNYRYMDELQVRFGQDKVQFGRQLITPSSSQQFVDSSVVTTSFVPGVDTGIMLHGKIAGGLVNYNLGGYGGAGQNTFRTVSDNAFAARFTVNPFGDVKYSEADLDQSPTPLLSIGANYFRNNLNGTSETNNLNYAKSSGWLGLGNTVAPAAQKLAVGEAIDHDITGFDAAFKWQGFSAQGEYFFAQAKGQSTKNQLHAHGFYVQAGYLIIPKTLELAARYSYFDPNHSVINDHWVETTGAISWYINNHNLKLQTDITNIHKQNKLSINAGPGATDDLQVRFQAQLCF